MALAPDVPAVHNTQALLGFLGHCFGLVCMSVMCGWVGAAARHTELKI